jgi:acylphosphatase
MRYIVKGRVQGVCYRSATVYEAQKLNLTGWVKNTHNGDVEVLACGKEKDLQTFESWLGQGPMLAKVESVTAKKMSWQEYDKFVIQY